jgi:hypothetical protein
VLAHAYTAEAIGQDAGGRAESVAAGNWRAGGMTELDRQFERSLAPVLRYPLQFCSGPANFGSGHQTSFQHPSNPKFA